MSFIFKDYSYDKATHVATFEYINSGIEFTESVTFNSAQNEYDSQVLDRALFLAFVLIGTSYYKTFPSAEVQLLKGSLDSWQADFFSSVYQDGLSQFAFENNLTRTDLAEFTTVGSPKSAVEYTASNSDPLVLQSGGKDSLLLASLLKKHNTSFTPWYFSSSRSHPTVLDTFEQTLATALRNLDKENLVLAKSKGALDGHVPITYMVLSVALIQAILLGKNTILTAIGHEGEEPYAYIDDLAVRHQWSKTWEAEQQLAQYVKSYISPDLKIGSPLRKYSELKIAQLFVENCWDTYSRTFSSCNVGNYKQGQENSVLGWCGNCAKCANSFLLFAPFVQYDDLCDVFNSQDLFAKPELTDVFKGLLGVEGVPKIFECVGEEAELRLAYQLAQQNDERYKLPFTVPDSSFDYHVEYPLQLQISLDQ